MDNYNVYNVFIIVNTQFLSFHNANPVSVCGTEILAGVVLNQCFSNVLRVHKTGPRANPGTWSQKWPKGNLFDICDFKIRTRDLIVSIQSDYPTEPKCSANLKICLMGRYIYPRSFQPLKNVLPARQFQWHWLVNVTSTNSPTIHVNRTVCHVNRFELT